MIVEDMARDIRRACAEDGAAILVAEQNLWFARRCADRLYLLDSGQVVFEGSWADFDDKPELKSRYLAV